MKSALLVSLAAGLLACQSTPFPHTTPLEPEAFVDQTARSAYVSPVPVRALGRAVLERSGAEMDFTLLVRCVAPDSMQLAALDDLGGTLLQCSLKAGQLETLARAPFVPQAVVDELAHCLALVFVPAAVGDKQPVMIDGGGAGLLAAGPDQSVLYSDSGPGGQMQSIEYGRAGVSHGHLRLSLWQSDPALHPGRIEIDSRRAGFRLDVRLAEWSQPRE
jgi:hypothetical protein